MRSRGTLPYQIVEELVGAARRCRLRWLRRRGRVVVCRFPRYGPDCRGVARGQPVRVTGSRHHRHDLIARTRRSGVYRVGPWFLPRHVSRWMGASMQILSWQ